MPPSLYASREWLAIESVWAALLVNSLLSYVFALLVVPFWRKEQERFPTAMSIRQALRVLTAYAAILGLALGFTSLVLQRPLIYLEGLIAMFVGYRILESDVLRVEWKVLFVPGVAVLVYAGIVTDWADALFWLPLLGWLCELLFGRLQAWHNRALLQKVPLALLSVGDIPQENVQLNVHKPGVRKTLERAAVMLTAGQIIDTTLADRLRVLADVNEGMGTKTVAVERAIPVTPFIVLGCLITAVLGGSGVRGIEQFVLWLLTTGS